MDFVLASSIGSFPEEKRLTENAVVIFLKITIIGCGQLGHKYF